MGKVRKDFHTAEGKARRDAEARQYLESRTWIPVADRVPTDGLSFYQVKLADGQFSSARFRATNGSWQFAGKDPVGEVIAWTPAVPLHSCSQ